jgi:hypothetical protein
MVSADFFTPTVEELKKILQILQSFLNLVKRLRQFRADRTIMRRTRVLCEQFISFSGDMYEQH